ncbi:helix-turn-helix domain-containing protein [Enterococcus sp. BWR-S5]|uniref:helix-turn-helix domain-containing protein n=1 Tax=Enterococcus sp. BWR-S5 TaxID=2787714 RepID=UPI001921F1A5|nr:helix-turn-helix transcriptional regulator [Enterococcus sp. BWR-S5]MBL1223905.1 helix-turn-helix transcriptional regulator [Enterococcus sp. BWR-S5]
MNRIKELRKARGATVKELGEKFNISQSMLTNYENGSSVPRNEQIWQELADYFNVSVPYLMGLTSKPSDYIESPFQDADTFIKNIEPLEYTVNSWQEFQALLFLGILDKEDIESTVKFMYQLLQNEKYDDKEIAEKGIFVADNISVDNENNAEFENLRLKMISKKRSES